MRLKVCGITRREDAEICAALGVQAIGFNFYTRSRRYVAPEAARHIADACGPFLYRVGVFVNEGDAGEVSRIARLTGLHALQFHGDESPDYCALFSPWPVIKAVRVGTGFVVESLERFEVSAFLLDGQVPGEYGGTGVTADWPACAAVARRWPVILSGGLDAGNVAEAVARVRPTAVDVCSGVESAPGVKDAMRLRDFVAALSGTHGGDPGR